MVNKLSEIIIVLFSLIILTAPITCFFVIIDDIHKIKEIEKLENEVNFLKQEIDYRDYITNDNLNQ